MLTAINASSEEPKKEVPATVHTSSSSFSSTTVNGKTISTSTTSLITTSSNTSWVDQKIEEIKPKRHGLSNAALATLKSPFIIVRPKPKEGEGTKKAKTTVAKTTSDKRSLVPLRKDMSKEPLTLQIVLNSSALINGKWLKENDSFRGYKLAQIQSNHVVLERKNKKIKLFIAKKSDNINISTK